MNKIIIKNIWNNKIIYLLLIGLSFFPYVLLNQPSKNIYSLQLVIDRWIPLLPIFAIPYILFIPFLLITLVFFIFFSNLSQSITKSLILCLFIAYGFYILYPTTVARPEIAATDIFSKLVLFIYSLDKPYNCFPSLHTSLSVLALLYWIQRFPNILIPMGIFVLSIILSTLFIKQHYIPDVLSGIALAVFCFSAGNVFR